MKIHTPGVSAARVQQMIDAGGGGGGTVPATSVGHVNPTNGSDTTGDGSYANPYATAQKAFDEGFTNIHLCGEGDAGTLMLDAGPTDHLWITGVGAADYANQPASIELGATSAVPRCELTLDNGANTTHIHIYSNRGVLFHLTGTLALASGAELQFYNAVVGNVTLNGATGATGAAGEGATGGQGGPGGILYLEHSILIGPTVELKAGNGGTGSAGAPDGMLDGGTGGPQGVGGWLIARWSIVHCTVDFGTFHNAPGGTAAEGGTDGAAGVQRGTNATQVGELSSFKSAPTGDNLAEVYRGSVVATAFIATQG